MALISGTNVLEISHSSGIPASTLYRARKALQDHQKNLETAHLDISRTGLARRIAAVAEDARQLRIDATVRNHSSVRIAALAAERQALLALEPFATELDSLSERKEAEALVEALRKLVGRHPHLTHELAADLATAGASPELVAGVLSLTPRKIND